MPRSLYLCFPSPSHCPLPAPALLQMLGFLSFLPADAETSSLWVPLFSLHKITLTLILAPPLSSDEFPLSTFPGMTGMWMTSHVPLAQCAHEHAVCIIYEPLRRKTTQMSPSDQ